MKKEVLKVEDIPAVLWGKSSDRIYIYVHGKMSQKEYAERFAEIAEEKGYQTLSFDLPEHGERNSKAYRCDIWNGRKDLNAIADYVFGKWDTVCLYACSLGAYFSLNTYNSRAFEKCLLQSPIVDMEWLVKQMMLWSDVSEKQLEREQEIETEIDTLRWDYYQYILSHPVKEWKIPTSILYGGLDHLQPREALEAFAERFDAELTISEKSEHPFMGPEDAPVVDRWLYANI
ncbi:MAG: alpha/beta hydrolase [Lachnospiraceae bacterium]